MLSFPVMTQVVFDYLHAGTDWRQGDWLINLGSGFVRRGVMGDAFIRFSDLTGIGLLIIVQAFQSLLFIALVFVIWVIGLIHSNRRLLIFLAASPAFILIFWAGDLQGTMRKELFGLLALALLALSSVKAGRSSLYPNLAVLLFTLGCIGNILHAFMAIPMVAGLYLTQEGGKISRRLFTVLTVITLAMAALWMGVAIRFRDVADLAGMCDPLLVRGFDESFCNGALSWMVTGKVDHLAELALRFSPAPLVHFFTAAVLSLVPAALTFFVFGERRALLVILIIAFIPLLPLYAIATDWGRWLSISYTSYVFLLIQAHATGRLTVTTQPSMRLIIPLVTVALFLTPSLDIDWKPGGAVISLIRSVNDFF